MLLWKSKVEENLAISSTWKYLEYIGLSKDTLSSLLHNLQKHVGTHEWSLPKQLKTEKTCNYFCFPTLHLMKPNIYIHSLWPTTLIFRWHPWSTVACQNVLQTPASAHLCLFNTHRDHMWFILQQRWGELFRSSWSGHNLSWLAVWTTAVRSTPWWLWYVISC